MSDGPAPFVPDELADLVTLALDLRWMRSQAAQAVWERIDAELWRDTRNPWFLLQSAGKRRLETLARDRSFREALAACTYERGVALAGPTWFASEHEPRELGAVAYFSMEFGLGEALPIYAGGLGILAGDHLKAASDLGVPLSGVGLLWYSGYFRQSFDAHDWQTEFYPPNDPSQLPLVPVRDADGSWLRVRLRFPGRIVLVRAWLVRVGRVNLYLLDANDLANAPSDRAITAQLYGGGTRTRLEQELVLGVGGYRLLRALGLRPEVCHLNEGHAAFAAIERARTLADEFGVGFEVALTAARAGNAFTTHTPVAAGFDRFEGELLRPYLEVYAEELDVEPGLLAALGAERETGVFNMAHLALRTSAHVNGVSKLHGEVSRQLFAPLFPHRPYTEVPIGSVTNGVHTPTWIGPEARALWARTPTFDAGADAGIWDVRNRARARLVERVRTRLAHQALARGEAAERLEAAQRAFDPAALTLGFARRFTAYKRPGLLLSDPERLARLVCDAARPVQIVVAGKAHPQDDAGKAIIREWLMFAERPDVRERVAFLVDYDLAMAEELVQGVDVWINTPRRPWEASGTSGMKVLANGGLNLSIADGWWAEVETPGTGWTISATAGPDQDLAEAHDLYSLLEDEIVPLFYARRDDGIPAGWLSMVRTSMTALTARFSTERMVRDYTDEVYLPAASAYRTRVANGCAMATELIAWRQAIDAHWDGVAFEDFRVHADADHTMFEADVRLGELPPGAVAVELFADTPGENGSTLLPERIVMDFAGQPRDGVCTFRAHVVTHRPAGDYTVRALPYHAAASVPLEAAQITWYR